jgi:hypothetical protein
METVCRILKHLAAVALCTCGAASALAQNPPAVPDPCTFGAAAENSKHNLVIIDAQTGNVEQRPAKTRYAKRASVTVLLVNKNPYLFEYTLTKTESAVKETALASGISLLGGLPASLLDKQPDKAPSAAAEANVSCPNEASPVLHRIVALANDLDDTAGQVSRLANDGVKAQDVLKEINDDKTGLRSTTADGATLCRLTHKTAGNLDFMTFPHTDPAKIGARLDEAAPKILDLRLLIDNFKARFKTCAPVEVDAAKKVADDFEKGLAAARATIAKSADLAKIAKDSQDAIRAVLVNPNAFQSRLDIGPFLQSTEVVVKATRNGEKPDKIVDIATTTLHFGQAPFFSLSGGVAYASVSKPQFKPIQGLERTRNGSLVEPEVQTRVIGASESATPVWPLVILNGRLYQWESASLHLSLGVTAKNGDGSTDVEYLLGFSGSLLDDQLFITLGAYGWRSPKLQGDLFVGQKIDMSVTELPVTRSTHWTLGVALTYKIK